LKHRVLQKLEIILESDESRVTRVDE